MFDYAEPYRISAGGTRPRGVGEHPHRGFETVTIVYQGELEHRDSGGNRRQDRPGRRAVDDGGAAASCTRSFRAGLQARRGGTFEVAQLWVNLPAKEKMSPPRYQAITSDQIPTVTSADGAGTA